METIKVKCRYCKYEWNCKSKMITVSCPSCLKKIQIREIEDDLENKKMIINKKEG